MKRRELLKSIPLICALPVINACSSGVSLGPGLSPQYLINNSMILGEILPYFPFKQSYNGIGVIQAINPKFSMAPEINKVRLGLNLQASLASGLGALTGIPSLNALAGQSRQGTCQLACGLRYDSKTRGIYLKDPVLERLDLQDIPLHYSDQAQSLINSFGPQFIEKRPIHTLEPSFASRVLKSITVKREGIALGFGL